MDWRRMHAMVYVHECLRACVYAWCACRLEDKFMELVLPYCGFLELHSGVRLVHTGFSKQ